MQLILIVQVSIALLAGELSGLTGMGAATGLLLALGAPLLVLLHGSARAWAAHRGMDRGSRAGVEAMYASLGRMGWMVAALMAASACSDLPRALEPSVGFAGASVLLLAVAVASTLVGYATIWSVEKRIRESSMIRALDGMAPLHPMPSRAAFVLAQARAGLIPMLAPLLVPIVLSEAARAVALRIDPDAADTARLVGGISGALVLFLLVPVIVPPLLGLRRLEAGPLREDLESLARAARVGVREIWVWPTDGLIANAAVMGVLPGLRCVMLSDCLLESMPREQVRAVMAHELGHVVRRHLPWMLVVVLACWTLAGATVNPVAQELYERFAATRPDAEQESILQGAALARDAAVLALGLVAFGFASRRFERQADTFAVQLLSAGESAGGEATPGAVDAMVGALGSVALLNHVPPTRSSWRHGSIAWRQDYLRTLVGRACDACAIDTLVLALRWGAVAVVAAGLLLGIMPL